MRRRNAIWITAAIGAVVHTAAVAAIVLAGSDGSFECGETSCWILIFADFPASLLYAGPTARDVTRGALMLGALWWGVLFAGVAALATRGRRVAAS